MLFRLLYGPLLLAAAIGIPYFISNGPNLDGMMERFRSATRGSATRVASGNAPMAVLNQRSQGTVRSPGPQGPGATLYQTVTPIEGLPAMSLNEVFNLNVSKEWVYQRWARKSTALSDLGMFGIRVPLVTGTQLHDLAGSLTYFFGNDNKVKRISFRGTTGDTTQLVRLAAQQYGLRQQATPVAGEQLFQIRRKEHVFSELRTRPAPVLWSSSPHDSFAVDFDLQSPDATTPLAKHLLPLPVVKLPPAPPKPRLTTAQQRRLHDAKLAGKTIEKEKSLKKRKDGWKAFFPRSRVPKKQVEGLERRGQLW